MDEVLNKAQAVTRLFTYHKRLDNAIQELHKAELRPNLAQEALQLTKEQLDTAEDSLSTERNRVEQELKEALKW